LVNFYAMPLKTDFIMISLAPQHSPYADFCNCQQLQSFTRPVH